MMINDDLNETAVTWVLATQVALKSGDVATFCKTKNKAADVDVWLNKTALI